MRILIKANSQRVISGPARYFICINATGTFSAQADRGDERDMIPGRSFGESDVVFRRLVLKDTSGADNTIEYDVSMQELKSPRDITAQETVFSENKATYAKGSGSILLDALHTFTGLDGANKRKSIAISNTVIPTGVFADDYAARILVSADGQDGVPIYPGGSIALETGGEITISAPNESATALAMEIFYDA